MSNTPEPTLRQLELFIAAAAEGSFAAAAEAMFVTPNAVFSAVTELETSFIINGSFGGAQGFDDDSGRAGLGDSCCTARPGRRIDAAYRQYRDIPRVRQCWLLFDLGCDDHSATLGTGGTATPEVQLDIQEGPIEMLAGRSRWPPGYDDFLPVGLPKA